MDPDTLPQDEHKAGSEPTADAASTEVTVHAPLEAVFGVVTDPTTYPKWLIGAREIRSVDEGWPAVGTAFHHTVGIRPFVIHDRTEVVAIDPPHRLVLRAHVGPLGQASICFELRVLELPEHADATIVRLDEEPGQGLLHAAWRLAHVPGLRAVASPLVRGIVWGRNALSLERLEEQLAALNPGRQGSITWRSTAPMSHAAAVGRG